MNTESFSCVCMKLFPYVRMAEDGKITVTGEYGITPTEKQRALGEAVGFLNTGAIFDILKYPKEPNPSKEYKEYIESRLTRWLQVWKNIRGKITLIDPISPGDTLRLHDESVGVGGFYFCWTISEEERKEGRGTKLVGWRVYVEPTDEVYVEPIVPD